MTSRHRLIAGVIMAIAVAGPAATASAQYRAPEPPPADPFPPAQPQAPDPGDGSSGRTSQPSGAEKAVNEVLFGSGWEQSYVIEAVHERNVGFLSPPGPSDVFGSLQGSLARWHRSARNQLRFGVDAGGYAYVDLKNRNRFDWLTRFRNTSQLSPRLVGDLSADFSRGHADTDLKLASQGVVLPPVGMTSGQVSGSLAARTSNLTSVTFAAAFQRVVFDSNVFLDTSQVQVSTAFSRRLSLRDKAGVRVQYQRWADTASIREDPGFAAHYSHVFGSGLTGSLELGAGRERRSAASGVATGATLPPTWRIEGSAGLSGRVRRTILTANYQHGLLPSYTPGVSEVSDVFVFGAKMPVGRRLVLLASGSLSYRSDTQATRPTSNNYRDVYVGAASGLGRYTNVVLGYRFRARTQSTLAETPTNDRLSLSVVVQPGRPAAR